MNRVASVLKHVQASDAAENGGGWGQTYDFKHPPRPLYNTCKQKLLEGKQVFSYTMNEFDIDLYLEIRKHYDFLWLEMQHSTMSYKEVEQMIAAGEATGEPGATPFLRIPDELESTLQKATDIGALGIILPTGAPTGLRPGAAWDLRPPPRGLHPPSPGVC
jgi:2-keto-3-deoxy-L-rhamnonate aldolase RhmA